MKKSALARRRMRNQTGVCQCEQAAARMFADGTLGGMGKPSLG